MRRLLITIFALLTAFGTAMAIDKNTVEVAYNGLVRSTTSSQAHPPMAASISAAAISAASPSTDSI